MHAADIASGWTDLLTGNELANYWTTTGNWISNDDGVVPGIPSTANPAGEWNTFHITCKGRGLTVQLNGEVVNDVDLDNPRIKNRPETGFIGFQDHALPLALRNTRIRQL